MNLTFNSDKMVKLALCLFAAYAAMLLPSDALAVGVAVSIPTSGSSATSGDPISTTLCTVVHFLTGGVGSGIATLAIIIIGIGALMGKVSWGMAIIVGIGVAVIFGAPQIVGMLSANGSGC